MLLKFSQALHGHLPYITLLDSNPPTYTQNCGCLHCTQQEEGVRVVVLVLLKHDF